jgi:hypothetical protein
MNKQTAPKKTVVKNNTNVKTKTTVSFIEKNALKIAIVLAVFALFLRLYRIGFLSLWVDEYMHAIAAINGKFKHGENNGILLTWFNTLFSFILGKTEFAMRFPVALLGAALIPTVYVLGQKIANFRVGLMAALFCTVSLYLIFWSRVDRPYGMVATFYMPLLLVFWLLLESKSKTENALSKFGINPKYIPWVILALALSMMSQLICFLFIFSAGMYGTLAAIDSWVTKTSKPWQFNAYNLLFVLNITAIILLLTPFGNQIMRPIIELFLPPNIATLILPNMKEVLVQFSGENSSKSLDVYLGVINTDFKGLKYFAWIGFVVSFIKNRKLSYFLISTFVVPFLLMSYVFREPVHAKYLTYIYPVFMISAAYTLYFIAFVAAKSVSQSFSESNISYKNAMLILFVFLSLGVSKRKDISEMLKTEKHGNIVPKEISEIHFVNWKQPCLFIKEQYQKGDVVMATVQQAPSFYLQLDTVVWFRQMHYDAAQKKYVPNLSDKREKSAYTFEQLVKTVQNNPRGWLLADYYFDNALTDPRAKQFVEQNFTYHFEACADGAVKVFSWNKAKPKSYQSAFVFELGKNPNQSASTPFGININRAALPPKVNLYLLAQGIDSNSEAYVIINDNSNKAVPIKSNGKPNQIDYCVAEVDASLFVNGENKIQFAYNDTEGNGDLIKGFVIFNIEIR